MAGPAAVLSLEALGKKYRIRHQRRQRYTALRDVMADAVRRPFTQKRPGETPAVEDFWALKDVSFDVQHGDVLGIIGANGAGKSTLLKILSRITEPTSGRAVIRGNVASLLEVGTGFHPELTGRENIFLNGAILGMSRREIGRKFDEIVAFAEIEKFLDTPVKHYSSGMYVRLAFAVAAHLEPEILVVDEVLAVGDSAFQRKCLGKMGDVSKSGRTILFVSHQLQAVAQLCSRAIWLDHGQKLAEGPTDEVIGRYLQAQRQSDTLAAANRDIGQLPADPSFRLRHIDVRQGGVSSTELVTGKPVEVTVRYELLRPTHGFHVHLMFCDADGSLIFDSLHNGDAEELPFVPAGHYLSTAVIPADFLAGRIYEMRLTASIASVRDCLPAPVSVMLRVHGAGVVNRAYAGYETRGKIAPLLAWYTNAETVER